MLEHITRQGFSLNVVSLVIFACSLQKYKVRNLFSFYLMGDFTFAYDFRAQMTLFRVQTLAQCLDLTPQTGEDNFSVIRSGSSQNTAGIQGFLNTSDNSSLMLDRGVDVGFCCLYPASIYSSENNPSV